MNTQQILLPCMEYSRILDEISNLLFHYAREEKQLSNVLDTLLEREQDEHSGSPNSWFSHMAASFAYSRILTDKDQLTTFLMSNEDELTGSSIEALSYWIDTPPFWSFFSIAEEHENNLFTITDELTQQTMLLYSPGLKNMQGRATTRKCVYSTLLLPNGACWQTLGVIHVYHLTAMDMVFFCKGIDADLYDKEGLTGIVNRHFLDFCQLDDIAAIPPVSMKGQIIKFYWKELHLPGITNVTLPGNWEMEKAGTFIHYLYTGPDAALLRQVKVPSRLLKRWPIEEFWGEDSTENCELYIDTRTERIGINSLSERGFSMLTCLLASLFPQINAQSCKPDWIISPPIVGIIDTIKHFSIPWKEFTAPFEKLHKDKQENSALDPINTLLKEYTNARNTGKPFDGEQRCKELHVDPRIFESVIDQYEKIMEKHFPKLKLREEDQSYSLDLLVPPPKVLEAYSADLDSSRCFTVLDDVYTYDLFTHLTGGSYYDTVRIGGLGSHFSNLFSEEFGWENGMHIMNSFFFMLLTFGDRPIVVRSYAIEILRIFHHTLLPSLNTNVDGFVKRFGTFVFRKLCTNGLCEITARPTKAELDKGTYAIRSTLLFDNFIYLAADEEKEE